MTIQKSQPHPRKIIRATVVNKLTAGTDLAGRWFCSRPDPAFVEELPCGLVYFTDEAADHADTAPRYYTRTLLLTVEILQMAEPSTPMELDDWFDSRAYEVEAVFLNDRQLGLIDIVQDSRLIRTQPTQLDMGGETIVSSLRLFFEIVYSADQYSTTDLVEFLRFTSENKSTTGTVAVDDVTIREA
jgi:hypothetical protein